MAPAHAVIASGRVEEGGLSYIWDIQGGTYRYDKCVFWDTVLYHRSALYSCRKLKYSARVHIIDRVFFGGFYVIM